NLDFFDKAIEKLGLPLVIKESYGSFGMQVYLANTKDEAVKIIDSLGHKEFVMQEFVQTSCGRDLRVNVVGGKVVATIYRYNDGDFRSNLTIGGKMKPYEISSEQAQLAIEACKALHLDFAGVDVMFAEGDEPVICEVNSNTHFKTTLDCTGINLADSIMEYIAGEIRK
ncbi:MAG: RimK family alpha-L-glutamate ligase, partial [Ruminococcaceae bacterium]|nr:RimK family alpha-L-glutamate ligase [Oscillospiraceae bacterium]